MQDKKHLEWKVTEWEMKNGEFKILRKELTKRGSVMISERDCNTNNFQTQFSKLWYELAPVEKLEAEETETKKPGRPVKN